MSVLGPVSPEDRRPVALVTGVGGQDGTYLAEQLVARGVAVHGILRPGGGSRPYTAHLDGVTMHSLDLSEARVAAAVVRSIAPDYVFHLAGISSVAYSWNEPVQTTRVNGVSAASLLDACVQYQESSGRRVVFVNASSAEIFAGSGESPQTEATRIAPTSPYGASKTLSHNLVSVYRSRGLEGINAILYNHESPRRPTTFVTRKITAAAAAIALGRQETLTLGNMSIRRDWGWAPDFVAAMLAMAEHGKGEDFVVATGESHSIEDFARAAFVAAGVHDWESRIIVDQDLARPADSAVMVGDAAKARTVLGWAPTKSFENLVAEMVEFDLYEESLTATTAMLSKGSAV